VLLSTAYFPPIEYFAVLARYSVVYIEACENYQKQSYRNRCHILTPDGVQRLQVPVVHERGSYELPIRDIRIEYVTPWVVRTERCLDAAYKSSAFYDYYRDSLFAILDSRPEKLWDLNLELIRYFCLKIGIAPEIRFTGDFAPPQADPCPGPQGSLPSDLRYLINPKKPNSILSELGIDKPYYQVFSEKTGFVPALSVMDLLFNEGPDSISHI